MAAGDDTVQGYRLAVAKKYGVNVAILYDKVMFWGTKGTRDDGWVYKKDDDMSDETALSVKQIRRAYEKLSELGVIEVKVMKVGDTPIRHFRLVQKGDSIEKAKRASLYIQNSTQNTQESRTFDLVEQPNNHSDVVNPTTELLKKLINIINPREKPTKERVRMLNGRLADYKAEEIIVAARAFSKSPWHKEHKQMSVDNLLAPSKFGRWYAAEVSDKPVAEFTSETVNAKNQSEMLKKWSERHEN